MRVLVATDDVTGPNMAGSALRAWELARVLAATGHQVVLSAGPGSSPPGPDGPALARRPPWRWSDAVVAPPWSLPPRAFLGGHRLVVDGVTPLLAELAAMPDGPAVRRRRRTAAARLPLAAARADAILAAGPAQMEWWSERLGGRFGLPLLPVPFGIPEQAPPADRADIPGVPADWAVVLWWGGTWPWLDLDTLLGARALMPERGVSVVVPTARRPGGGPGLGAPELAAACRRHRLRPPQVVPLERWVPYAERHLVLNRAAVVAALHRSGNEAVLSFRTRALDALWAGVPLLLTEGGEVARSARARGWGAVVPPGDPRAAAAALEMLLGERAQARCRAALAASRSAWTWPHLAQPLVKVLPTLPVVGRRSLAGAAMGAAWALLAPGRWEATP